MIGHAGRGVSEPSFTGGWRREAFIPAPCPGSRAAEREMKGDRAWREYGLSGFFALPTTGVSTGAARRSRERKTLPHLAERMLYEAFASDRVRTWLSGV